MIELTVLQEKILKRFALGKQSVYAAVQSIESDGPLRQKVDDAYREVMLLVDYELAADLSSQPRFKETIDTFMKDEGRVVKVLGCTTIGELMFQRSISRRIN